MGALACFAKPGGAVLRLSLLRAVALCWAIALGSLGLLSAGAAARPVSGPCGDPAATPASPAPEPAQTATPTRTGAVRLSLLPGGWLIRAPLRRTPSYVSQPFAPTGRLTLTFCLRAPRRAATRVVQVTTGSGQATTGSGQTTTGSGQATSGSGQAATGDIQLALRGGHLRLSVSRRGQLSTVARPVAVTGRPTPIRLVVSDGGTRVEAYADGQRQATFRGGAASARLLRIGSLTRSGGGTLTLSNVTISLPQAGISLPAAPGAPLGSGSGSCTGSGSGSGPDSGSGSCSGSGSGSGAGSGSGSGAGSSTGSAPFVDQPAPWPGNPFSPTSFWNAPLAADAPLDAKSQAYATEVLRQVKDYHTWMETTSYSVPVYVVGPHQSTQHVTLDTWGPDLQAEFNEVPIPSTAQASAGTDQAMTVWQPSTDRMWDFWGMHMASDGWHARWGGEMDDVSGNPGYFSHSGQTANWGATATGLPLLGGLITEADLRRGYINHALAIDLVETDKAYWSWPAQRTDGDYWSPGITPIPEGTRFRLPPTLNIASLDLPPIDRMLAEAAQKYGIVVADGGPTVAFFGEDPKSIGSNPWPAAFQNQYMGTVLDKFPWSNLEALKTQLSCCWFVGA